MNYILILLFFIISASLYQGRALKEEAISVPAKKGYYFPDTGATDKSYKGEVIEAAYTSNADLSQFDCLPCSKGCEACVDESSCL